ncbi:MAG TPA: hypothetical protein VNS09_10925 [Solirubrobacter sp.]|nr:hypothetical protein [Solirubrobacter sp.]
MGVVAQSDGTLVCPECRKAKPLGEIIRKVQQQNDRVYREQPPRPELLGFTGGAYGVGAPVMRTAPARTGFVDKDIWVSFLADGTSARYIAGKDPRWREGENVCRDCRDRRVPASVHGRANES